MKCTRARQGFLSSVTLLNILRPFNIRIQILKGLWNILTLHPFLLFPYLLGERDSVNRIRTQIKFSLAPTSTRGS